MWLFARYGFFSAVCARQGAGGHDQPVDPDRLMIRARLKTHLAALFQRFPELLGDADIQHFPGSDYAFRIFVPKPIWGQVLAALNDELDFDNFKSEVAQHQGLAGAAYEQSLHKVWSVMRQLQK
ncbi:hypothetical protein [Planctellipticum variicoloris]|uniref:hypothetical protein n=1 Tax=Planctellipticum variicoloris TaxID=3064265 RepID=UPI0030133F0C|nr:hypothetical protein SH412_002023 [Planctomycetaceae bacterium SH412]